MSSPLITYTLLSPHRRARTAAISRITIHHTAGVAKTAAEIGANLQGSRVASANYGIGNDGSVGLFVPEDQRSIASSSTVNDNMAVTIEVSNSEYGGRWPVSDAAYRALIDLCADICLRNGIERLVYTGDTKGNLTRHNMFAATACPGPYLQERFPAIAEEVNERLEEERMTGEKIFNLLTEFLNSQPTSEYAEEASRLGVASGIFKDGDHDGLVDNPKGLLTRQDYALTLMRLGLLKAPEGADKALDGVMAEK